MCASRNIKQIKRLAIIYQIVSGVASSARFGKHAPSHRQVHGRFRPLTVLYCKLPDPSVKEILTGTGTLPTPSSSLFPRNSADVDGADAVGDDACPAARYRSSTAYT
jgi:hypothetical protein